MTLGDSQNRAASTYVEMALAVQNTSRLKFCTWVTNPLTRHPAVAAGELATLQVESGGRIEVGIGRGDSALAYLGLAPVPLPYFEKYLTRLGGYLRGEQVPLDPELDSHGIVRGAETLGIAKRPETNGLDWLPPDYVPVPIIVAASGPKVMAVGARLGDGVTSIVGPSIERLRWARDTILEARQVAGLAIDGLRLGASAVIAVNENRSIARDLARPMTSVQSRFAIMHGRVNGPASEQLRSDLMKVRTSYDMTHHAEGKSDQAEVMSEEFIDAFAIAGPSTYCIERIQEIMALGFSRFTFSIESPNSDPEAVRTSHRLVAEKVLPALR